MTSRRYILLIVFNIYFVSIQVIAYNPLLTYLIRFTKIEMFPNISGAVEINEYKGKDYINGKMVFSTSLIVDTAVVVFHRCNIEGIDCEYFQSWTLENICPKLLQKNQVWSSWYDAFDPPMACPLDKRNYVLKNATFDIRPIVTWYGEATNYQWRVKQSFYSNNIFTGYYTVQFKFFGYRKRLRAKRV